MEKTLKRLFDFQRFEQNGALRQVIDGVRARHESVELSVDDLCGVNAAIRPHPADERGKPLDFPRIL